MQFIWGEDQQQAFDEIKRRLIKLPALHLPDNKGRFHLSSDTSKFTTGSALYQIQNGKLKLIAYMSTIIRSSMELFYHRVRNVWFRYKYCQFCSSPEKK